MGASPASRRAACTMVEACLPGHGRTARAAAGVWAEGSHTHIARRWGCLYASVGGSPCVRAECSSTCTVQQQQQQRRRLTRAVQTQHTRSLSSRSGVTGVRLPLDANTVGLQCASALSGAVSPSRGEQPQRASIGLVTLFSPRRGCGGVGSQPQRMAAMDGRGQCWRQIIQAGSHGG